MTTKVTKAQLEVWEWKDKLYEEIKNIPKLERLKYLSDKVSSTINLLKIKKSVVA